MKHIEKECVENGKANLKYAWVFDKLKSEREHGMTLDMKLKEFITDKFFFSIIDAPGTKTFLKNMISAIT